MPFFNGNVSSEIWIQSSRIGRHVEELKSSVNSSGRPITTIGVAGHRGQRFQLGVSKDLFPNGVTILARENMQSALIRIDLEADIAHTHHVLDPSSVAGTTANGSSSAALGDSAISTRSCSPSRHPPQAEASVASATFSYTASLRSMNKNGRSFPPTISCSSDSVT